MARVDDELRSGTAFFASPSFDDLTMQDSLGTRGRPFARYEKWSLNGAGFRGGEIGQYPRPGCVRVAVLGASETFGYEESPGKEYPAQLSDSLNRSACYEVINSGVVGLPTPGQVRLWENWVARFGPTVVVIYPSPVFYLSNEPPKFSQRRKSQADNSGKSYIGAKRFSSRIFARLHDHLHYPQFIQRRRVAGTIAREVAGKSKDWMYTAVPDDRLQLFRSHLDSLVASIRAKGAVPVLVTHAMRFGEQIRPEDRDMLEAWRQFTPRASESVLIDFERRAADVVREAAREDNVPLADVANAMTGRTKWFADFVHFNDDGAGVIAGTIAKTVRGISSSPNNVASHSERTVQPSSDKRAQRTPIARESGRGLAQSTDAR